MTLFTCGTFGRKHPAILLLVGVCVSNHLKNSKLFMLNYNSPQPHWYGQIQVINMCVDNTQ